MAIVLFLDSVWRPEHIFDANNIAGFVLFSLYFNYERNMTLTDDNRKDIFSIVVSVLWSLFGIFVTLNIDKKMPVFYYIPVNRLLVSCLFMTVHAFVFHEDENDFFTFFRIYDFVILSLTWTYLFYAQNLSTNTVFDCIPCMIRFGPVLFVTPTVTLLASASNALVLMYMYYYDAQDSCMGEERTCTTLLKSDEHSSDLDIEDCDIVEGVFVIDANLNETSLPQGRDRDNSNRNKDTVSNRSKDGTVNCRFSNSNSNQNTTHNSESDDEVQRAFLEAVRANAGRYGLPSTTQHAPSTINYSEAYFAPRQR